MKLQLVKGTTSKIVSVFVYDSSVTTGAGLTGLLFNTASLTGYYYREGAGTGATQITLATATIGTWATGGFVEIDATDMPGWYELHLPDAVIASGADSVGVQLKGAANMSPVNLEIQLTDFDLHTATPAVNVTQISADTAAADNLEAAYDGTGYAGGTILQDVNVAAISDDTVAADNLESYTDGTTPMPVNATQISGDGPAADNLESMFDGTGYAGGTTKLDVNIVSAAADTINASALAADAVTEITDDIMAEVVETQGSYTVQQVLSVVLAVLAGETSASGNTIATPDGVSTRVAATTNASNERTAMTLTPSA